MELELKPLDLFCTRNPMSLGRAINVCQTIVSRDGKSTYSHAGIILDSEGTTFEALWTNKQQNLFEAYNGMQVCIARAEIEPEIARKVIRIMLDEYEGKRYPFHRLFFQLIPVVAKYASFKGKFLVCSELVAKALYLAYQLGGKLDAAGYCWPRHKYFTGTTPDTLSDEWHRWKGYEIVFEGILKG